MYDEIKRDLNEKYFKDHARKKVARWDLALKGLLHEKSDGNTDLRIGWLSERSGLSKSYLLNVISGKIKDPPSNKLIRIADAFGISFPELATRGMGAQPDSFFKTGFGERGFIDYSQHGFSIQSLSPPGMGRRDFFFGIMILKPLKELKRWQFDKRSMIGVYVEQGTIEIIHGGKMQKLHSNESAYFDASIPHRFKNVDTFEAKIFIVTRPALH
jgi:transcriptional regulator with XRE-family HTH domain